MVIDPFGDGVLCLDQGASPLARLAVTPVAGNVLTTRLPLQMPPTAAATITAGSTWSFQAWFADPAAGGAGFNLSSDLRVTFQ